MRSTGYSTAFPTAILLLWLCAACSGLKCFVCNSAFDKDCDDIIVPEKYVVTCTASTAFPLASAINDHGVSSGLNRQVGFQAPQSANFTFCRKSIATVPSQENGDTLKPGTTRTIRACGYEAPDANPSCKWAASFGIQKLQCTCYSDSCNHASVGGPTFILFTATILLIVGVIRSNFN